MKKLYEEESIKAIADSIRCKTGSSDKLKLADMSSKIDGIDLETYQKIIDRTITEINLPNLTSVGGYGFYYCLKLVKLVMPIVETISYGVFNMMAYDIEDDSINSILDFGTKLKSIEYTSQTYNSWVKHLVFRTPFPANIGNGPDSSYIVQACRMCGYSKDYKNKRTADGWVYAPKAYLSTYKSKLLMVVSTQFRALEDYTVDGTITGELDESKI